MKRIFLFLFVLLFAASCTSDQDEESRALQSSPAAISSKPSPTSAGWWQPETGLTWQWQLDDGPIDTNVQVDVYDIDLDAGQDQVDFLKSRGARVVCYISVGSWEEWRADAPLFPQELIGKDYAGWSGEKWLDIRRIDLLEPILRQRLDRCQAKGFDAVEPDNMDIYANDTGFDITPADQLNFALWLAQEAHTRSLAIGAKNAPDQAAELVDVFDFAITEDCFDQGWCEQMLPYIAAGKPVFAAEYTDTRVDFDHACAWGKEQSFSFIQKNRQLDTWLNSCP